MEKQKVLVFIQDGVGGAERMSVLIGKSLDYKKYDICFCLVETKVKSSIRTFIPKNYRIEYIPNKNVCQLIYYIVKRIKKEKPTIIFSSVYNISNKLLLFKWLYPRINIIVRCDNYLYTYTDLQQRIIASLYPKAECIIAQTEEMQEELVGKLGININKVVTLHNPIDKITIDQKVMEGVNPYPNNGKKHLVAVGRFHVQKGFDLLVNAFITVCEHREDVDLTIVGDYTMDGMQIINLITNEAQKAGISDRISCIGYKDNPYIYIKYADGFVLSSRWEGLPNALIESLYLGIPSAAFKCIPIIERIIEDGKTGYCAEKEDCISLANAILKILNMGRIVSSYKSSEIKDFTDQFDKNNIVCIEK